jgi:transketolase
VREVAAEIRHLAVRAAVAHGSCHIGSSLSCAEILAVTVAGGAEPRDRFVMSKGHAAAALYAALAIRGDLDPDAMVAGYTADGSLLAGHVEHHVPGVEVTTGSLGHGLSIGVGLALADRMAGDRRRTVVLLGDGELGEGSVWEAAALAGHLGLEGLTAVVDANGLQGLGRVEDVLQLEPLAARFVAFGWSAAEVDGHDCDALAAGLKPVAGRPRCVVARTIKGRGLPSLEDTVMSHYRSFRGAAGEALLAELEAA